MCLDNTDFPDDNQYREVQERLSGNGMDVEYQTPELEQLATDRNFSVGLPAHVETKFRSRVQFIIAAPNEKALYAMQGSLQYKKLKGAEDGIRTMRLNDKYRMKLILLERSGQTVLRVLDVGDFHDD